MGTVLITAANSAQAHRLKSKLGTGDIILGDHLDMPEFMVKAGKMLRLPNPASVTYTHEMLTLCLDHDIKIVYALNEQELDLLMESKQLFNEYGIDLLIVENEI